MGKDFSNKNVLVTGGTGALGRSITSAFVTSNAKVISSYILDTEIEQLRKEKDNKSAVQLIKADLKGRRSRETSFKYN